MAGSKLELDEVAADRGVDALPSGDVWGAATEEVERAAAPALVAALVEEALRWPEAHVDYPWGEMALKVRGKVFLFLSAGDQRVSFTLKLTDSHPLALTMPGCAPAGYNLGKSGWITVRVGTGALLPPGLVRALARESYRNVAPKRLAAALGA